MNQNLFKEDYDICVQNTGLENLIYISSEATLHVFEYVHTQNYRIWVSEKSTIFCKYQDNIQKIKIWCTTFSNCIVGPYFFDNNVKAENYVEMLKT